MTNKFDKEKIKNELIDLTSKYPQEVNGKVVYTIAGSLSMFLLSLADQRQITKYHIVNKKKLFKIYSYTADKLFDRFKRDYSNIDLEFLSADAYPELNVGKSEIELAGEKIIVDRLNNPIKSGTRTIYSVFINGTKVYIDDFKCSLAYKLKTFSMLSSDRFYPDSPKYNYTIKKYSHDFHYLIKIFTKYVGNIKYMYNTSTTLNLYKNDQYFGISLIDRLNYLHLNKSDKQFILDALTLSNERDDKKYGIIVYTFPAAGKTYFAKHGTSVFDLTTTGLKYIPNEEQKKLDKEAVKGTKRNVNPNFEKEYLARLKAAVKHYDFVLVPYIGLDVAIKNNFLNFWLVYPDQKCKKEYLARMKKRGNNNEFVKNYNENWNDFLLEKENDRSAFKKIVLDKGEYLEDALVKYTRDYTKEK